MQTCYFVQITSNLHHLLYTSHKRLSLPFCPAPHFLISVLQTAFHRSSLPARQQLHFANFLQLSHHPAPYSPVFAYGPVSPDRAIPG